MLSLWEFFPYPPVETGTFTITGQSASFEQVLAASSGAFALTGKPAAFSQRLGTATGTYTFTGQSAAFAQYLRAATGTYTFTGKSAAFAQRLATATGTYTFTGFAASFSVVTTGGSGIVSPSTSECALELADGGLLLLADGLGGHLLLADCAPAAGGGINWLPYGFMWGRGGYPRETEAAARHARHIAYEAEKVKFGGRKATAEAKRKLRVLIAQANEIAEENELTAELRRLERYLAQHKGEQALLAQQKLIIELALRVEVILLARVVDDDEALMVLMMSNAIH